jgi:dihydrofolate synthase/folylpolyglutamate synthase
VRALYALTIPREENAHPAARIAAAARSLGIEAHETESVGSAFRAIIGREGPGQVLICGSLHLAGVVLAENG